MGVEPTHDRARRPCNSFEVLYRLFVTLHHQVRMPQITGIGATCLLSNFISFRTSWGQNRGQLWLTASVYDRKLVRSIFMTIRPGTRSKSVSQVMRVTLCSKAVAAMSVSTSPMIPGPCGRRIERLSAA
jgi:hypothetical protein